MLTITKKIVGYKVLTNTEEALADKKTESDLNMPCMRVEQQLKRPLRLDNEWRLKPPYASHALYVRLNAIVHEGKKYPYEIFFNTKDVKDIKWLNALTVTISTAFRTAIETGTSLQPLIDNFKESCDTESPYLSKVTEKPKFVNGLVAEIGLVIEVFNKECNIWNYSQSSHEKPATEEERLAAFGISFDSATVTLKEGSNLDKGDFVTTDMVASVKVTNPCPDCGEQLVIMDGCPTCTSCGYSKCS
jgi:ribonucleoside-diphosphate reductase alpha chain